MPETTSDAAEICGKAISRKQNLSIDAGCEGTAAGFIRNHNATDKGNVDLRSFKKKIYIQSLENEYKVVGLPVQKL